jgi:predicted N-acetyltransferase YhbS
MVTIRNEVHQDIDAREDLLDRVWGTSRFLKTAERLRDRSIPAKGLALIAEQDDAIVGTVRLWDIAAGSGGPALLLGPLAVEEARRGLGIGAALMRRAIGVARRRGHKAVILVGDAPYYGRFGFSTAKTGALWLPGPVERHRLLGLELVAGALDGARGLISATGNPAPKPTSEALIANLSGSAASARHAA